MPATCRPDGIARGANGQGHIRIAGVVRALAINLASTTSFLLAKIRVIHYIILATGTFKFLDT